jgi:hypothetical protein
VRWTVTLPASYRPDEDYGFAWSPLIVDDLLLLPAGSRGLALRVRDGTFAWGNDGKPGACASPVPFEHQGRRGVALIATNPGRNTVALIGVEPRSGAVLWRYDDWPERWGAACNDLVVHDGKVFVSTAEEHQRCGLFAIAGKTLRPLWSSARLPIYTGGSVLLDGHLYAVSRSGVLKCLSWESGAERWAQRGFGKHGSLIAADGTLLVQASEGGELVAAAADPTAWRERRRAKVFAGPDATFTPPVLANGRLYCRSYAGEVVCLDVGGARD